jgi:hypothetical protein
MVNVTNRANVDVRLIALEFTFCHVNMSSCDNLGGPAIPVWTWRLRLSAPLRKTFNCWATVRFGSAKSPSQVFA